MILFNRFTACLALLSCFLLSVASCGFVEPKGQHVERINMSPLSHFKHNEGLLADGDSLKLLFASWDTNDERMGQAHFIQVIALKIATGDTINVLTGFDTKFEQEDGDRIFVFQKYDKDFKQIMAQQSEDFLAKKDKILSDAEIKRNTTEVAEKSANIYNYPDGPAVYIDGTMTDVFQNEYPYTIGKLNRL